MMKYLLVVLLLVTAAPRIIAQTIFKYTYKKETLRFETIEGHPGECRLIKQESGGNPYGYNSSPFNIPDEAVDPDTKIRYKVTSIGMGALQGNRNVREVVFPVWLTTIENDAFNNCEQLATITLPDNLLEIGARAFMLCTSLKNVETGTRSMLERIHSEAFRGCRSLKTFTIPEEVTYLGAQVFAASGLLDLQFNAIKCPVAGTRYEPPFSGRSGLQVTFGPEVRVIPDNFFSGVKKLYQVDIPDGISEVGEAAFLDCPDLQIVTVPESVTEIGSSAFEKCVSLGQCDIHGVGTIGNALFKGCTSLAEAALAPRLSTIPDETFMGCVSLSRFTIPSTVRMIGKYAFYGCRSLPLDARDVWPNGLATIDDRAFEGCSLLTRFPQASVRYGAYSLASTALESAEFLSIDKPLGKAVFADCKSLKSVNMQPASALKELPDSLFAGCSALLTPAMPIGIEAIGNDAFLNCNALTMMRIPADCKSIGSRAFEGCTVMQSVTLDAALVSMGVAAFRGCSSLAEISVPNKVEHIWSETFKGCTSLQTVMLGYRVKSISEDAFAGCEAVREVTVTTPTPPAVTDNFFASAVYEQATLNEPFGKTPEYRAAQGWRLFQKRSTLDKVEVTNLIFDPTSDLGLMMEHHSSLRIKVTVLPENATNQRLNWGNSDPEIVSVGTDGTITALKPGEAMVTIGLAEPSPKVPAQIFRITVVPRPVSMIFIDEEQLELTEGDMGRLTAAVYPANATDRSVEWSSSDESVVKVSADGELTALVPGEAVITVKATDGSEVEATCRVKVLKRIILVDALTLDEESLELTEGDSRTLTAVIGPDDATDRTVDWSSSDESVVTVTADGTVTALRPGEAVVKVSAHDGSGLEASCSVKVVRRIIPVTEVVLKSDVAECTEGDEVCLSVAYSPDDATDPEVTWSVSDPSMAEMTAPGIFRILAAGEVTVTVTVRTPDGAEKSASVKLKAAPRIYLVESIDLSVGEVDLTAGETLQLSALVGPAHATNRGVRWAVSDEAIATVSGSGLLTAISAGTATVTATALDGSGVVAECIVRVAARPDPSGIHAPGVENADTPVTVSDLNGRVAYRGALSGLRAVSLPHGYYIVLTADRAIKIRL